MDIRQKIRRNNLSINLTAGVIAMGLAGYAAAANDYDRIRKDINVMADIVRSAFEHTEDCQRCSVSIEGHYLADQGIVFDVSPGNNRAIYSFRTNGDFEFDSHEVISGIPDIVSDVLADVQVTLDNSTFVYSEGEDWAELGERVREQLHEARIEKREIERDVRELKIEAINAEKGDRQELEAREEALESRIKEIESRENALRGEINEQLTKRRAEKEARRAERRAERQAQFDRIETIVLNTFCDYSRTMRSLPKGERVSIIMKQAEDQSRIYILERDDMDSCDSQKTNLRDHALSYAF